MGEEVAGLPEAASVGVATEVAPEPIGAYLAQQRQLRGIGLDELARTTCIPLRSLVRLESGAFDDAPDGFARGFVRTVASALGLDPDDAVRRMLAEAQPGARRRAPPLPEVRPWAGVVMIGLLLAAGVILLVTFLGGGPEPAELKAQRVLRRDAVRELARSEGLLPPRGVGEPSAP